MAVRTTVVGSGYVGTVVAACLAHLGHDVVGLESDREKCTLLAQGTVPFFEPGLESVLAAAVAEGNLRFTDDASDALDGAEVVFLCVGTPSRPDGRADV